jgi:hypothetical protein
MQPRRTLLGTAALVAMIAAAPAYGDSLKSAVAFNNGIGEKTADGVEVAYQVPGRRVASIKTTILLCAITLARQDCEQATATGVIQGPDSHTLWGCMFQGQAYLANVSANLTKGQYVKVLCSGSRLDRSVEDLASTAPPPEASHARPTMGGAPQPDSRREDGSHQAQTLPNGK